MALTNRPWGRNEDTRFKYTAPCGVGFMDSPSVIRMRQCISVLTNICQALTRWAPQFIASLNFLPSVAESVVKMRRAIRSLGFKITLGNGILFHFEDYLP